MLNVTIMSTVPGTSAVVIGLTDWELRPRYDGCVDFVINDQYVAGRLARAFLMLECQLKAHDAKLSRLWDPTVNDKLETVNPWWKRWWVKVHKWIPKGL